DRDKIVYPNWTSSSLPKWLPKCRIQAAHHTFDQVNPEGLEIEPLGVEQLDPASSLFPQSELTTTTYENPNDFNFMPPIRQQSVYGLRTKAPVLYDYDTLMSL